MQLQPHQLYHIYNRGNNRTRLFYGKENYSFFKAQMKKCIIPHCDLLAYSLLPNHFHFLVYANERTNLPFQKLNEEGVEILRPSPIRMTQFAHGVQMLLSSYAKAINKRQKRTGSLFTQNTHAKMTSSDSYRDDYSLWCFSYIHFNPVAAGLVNNPQDWPYSSFQEYLGQAEDPICNIELAKVLLSLDINDLFKVTTETPDEVLSRIL